MRRTVLFSLLPIVLLSCARYEYFTLDSDTLKKNASNEFVAETDTVKVVYNFSGNGCPLKLVIFNKTDQPLTLDWKKSAIILNDSATSFYAPVYSLDAVTGGTVSRGYLRTYAGSIDGSISGKEEFTYIPPKSSVAKNPLSVPVKANRAYLFDSVKLAEYKLYDQSIPYKKLVFNSQQSPVFIRSYLTFTLGGKEFVTENLFYVNEIWQLRTNPFIVADGSGNKFYVRE